MCDMELYIRCKIIKDYLKQSKELLDTISKLDANDPKTKTLSIELTVRLDMLDLYLNSLVLPSKEGEKNEI